MAGQFVDSAIVTSNGVSAALVPVQDSIFVGQGGSLAALNGGAGMRLLGWNDAFIDGQVFSASYHAIYQGAASSPVNIHVGETGKVLAISHSAVELAGVGSNSLINHGEIVSEASTGPTISLAGGNNTIQNYGLIEAIAGLAVSFHDGSIGSANRLDNYGTINGGMITDGVDDTIVNHGLILGDVSLNGGNDFFDNRDGELLGNVAGGDGNDTIAGGAGNDTFSGGYQDDLLYGFAGDDALVGGGGTDILDGGAGNDQLVGWDGTDIMTGGTGNDIYQADLVTDRAIELAGGGTDTVEFTGTAGTFILGANIEKLLLAGVSAINGTGNVSANTLIGNTAANRLTGLAGRDAITGGGGNDTFVYASAADTLRTARDVIRDFDDAGNDKIDLSAVYSGKLVFKGFGAFTGAHQVHIRDIAGPDVLVEVNLSGSLAPEMVIRLANTTAASMAAGDFVL